MQKAPLIYRIFFTSSVILFLWNCTSNLPQSRSNSVKVGTISGPETDVMEVIRDVAKEQYDLEIEIVSFNDFVTPNLALAEGSLDANAFQHLPYLKEANKAHEAVVQLTQNLNQMLNHFMELHVVCLKPAWNKPRRNATVQH